MALPRTKLVEAMAAAGLEAARRPARTAGVVRRRAEAIVYDLDRNSILKVRGDEYEYVVVKRAAVVTLATWKEALPGSQD